MRKQFLPLFTFLAISLISLGETQPPLFSIAPPVAVGDGSGHLVLADVNGDGKLDLLSQHLLQHVVTIQLGDGVGNFTKAPGSPISLAYAPGDIKVGDVNGDGFPDLGVTNSERNTIDIFLGNGAGNFSLSSGSPFRISPDSEFKAQLLQFLDINEDGQLDIVVTNNQQNSIYTLLGNGRGSFTSGPSTTFPARTGRYSFAFGDLNGDGHPDIAIASSNDSESSQAGNIVLLRGNGKGDFRALSDITAPSNVRYLTLADLNGDGRSDLALVYGGNRSCQLATLINQGNGKFATGSNYHFGKAAFGLVAVDVNQDRRSDLVIATVDSVTVLLNGDRGFAPAAGSPFHAGPGAYHLAIGDVNHDGKPDVAASSFEGKTATILIAR